MTRSLQLQVRTSASTFQSCRLVLEEVGLRKVVLYRAVFDKCAVNSPREELKKQTNNLFRILRGNQAREPQLPTPNKSTRGRCNSDLFKWGPRTLIHLVINHTPSSASSPHRTRRRSLHGYTTYTNNLALNQPTIQQLNLSSATISVLVHSTNHQRNPKPQTSKPQAETGYRVAVPIPIHISYQHP